MDYLPKKTISQLNFATSLLENFEIEINNNGNSEKISIGQLISKINTDIRLSTNGFLGQIISGFRTDIPNGYLWLDGSKYINLSTLFSELKKAFQDGKIPYTENLQDWLNKADDTNTQTRGSVFMFYVNFKEDYFYVPKLKKHQYIANGTSIGEVYLDQMQKMTGNFLSFDRGQNFSAKLFKILSRWSASLSKGGGDNWGTNILFDNSEIVRTGEENWGFHAECPYFICVNTIESGIDSNIYAKMNDLQSETAKRSNQYNELSTIILQLEEKLNNNDKGRFFDTANQMNSWLSNPNNKELLTIGFRFFIGDQDSPDYLWSGSSTIPIAKGEILLDNYYTKSIIDVLLKSKVDKVLNKGLSTNDYTNEDRERLKNSVSSNQLNSIANSMNENLQAHTNNKDNPHKITAKQVGAYSIKEINDLLNELESKVEYNEIQPYGLKYFKLKELINKSDAGNFVISCEYTSLNLGIIPNNSEFIVAMNNRYSKYYSNIELAKNDEELQNITIYFSDLVEIEINRLKESIN